MVENVHPLSYDSQRRIPIPLNEHTAIRPLLTLGTELPDYLAINFHSEHLREFVLSFYNAVITVKTWVLHKLSQMN